jgi:hypothetical protein
LIGLSNTREEEKSEANLMKNIRGLLEKDEANLI